MRYKQCASNIDICCYVWMGTSVVYKQNGTIKLKKNIENNTVPQWYLSYQVTPFNEHDLKGSLQ
jgi:hypothetical protein